MSSTPKPEGSANPLIDVRRLRPEDSANLVALFERCYGDTYPSQDFYSAERLQERIQNRTLRSVVAVDAQGQVVGHTGLTVRVPAAVPTRHDARAAIAGNTVVDPEFRGHGVLGKMGAALKELCTSEGFVGYVHFPTTAHTIMQKRSVESGGVETGLQLAYVPATTDYLDIDQPGGELGRRAVTVVYQPFERAPLRKVYLPDRYAERIEVLFRSANLKRLRLTEVESRSHSSQLSFEIDPRRGLLHIQIESCGSDLGEQLDVLLQTYPPGERAPAIVHADLYLDDPNVHNAVELLCSRGFFYCGLLPEIAHTDVLRLQRLHSLEAGTEPFDVLLANPEARNLLDQLKQESSGY